MKIQGNTILITGGGSGIGAALAHRLHDAGNRILIVGRRMDVLKATAAGRANIHAMALDIDDPASVKAFAARVVAEYPTLNVLVNNAGIMRFEDISHGRALHDAEATVTTNLLGPIRMTDALIDHLREQPDAAIVNVTSGLAFVPMPGTPTYNATKAALHSYTVTLRQILKNIVEVIEIIPPAVRTDLTPGQARREGYQPLAEFADQVIALLQTQPTPPEILVDRVRFMRFAEAEGKFDTVLEQVRAFTESERAQGNAAA